MTTRKKYIIVTFIVVSIIFVGTYYVYFNKYRKSKYYYETHENSNAVMNKLKFENMVQSSTKIIFKTTYTKSGEEIIEEKVAGDWCKDIIGYDRAKLAAYYSQEGFVVENMNSAKVTLVKKLNRYSPNKYVIGITKSNNDEYLAIFKTDEKGYLIIEKDEDITNTKVGTLREEDIEMLRNGSKDLQFGTKDEAKEVITQYQS